MQINWQAILDLCARGNVPPPRRDIRREDDWREVLSAAQYHVLRQHGTEAAFSSEMCGLFAPGRYACAGCGTALFDAGEKFDSGTGWPSFTQPLTDDVIAYFADHSHGMVRVEVRCNVCEGHLGHVFPDGPPPSKLRYCINALALDKVAD